MARVWAELSQGLETLRNARIRVTAILTGPPNSDTVYLGTAGAGVFRSTDGGATWYAFNDGLENLNVRALHEPKRFRHPLIFELLVTFTRSKAEVYRL
jgi:hypothetical protein